MKYYKQMPSPLGTLTLIEEDGFLTDILFQNDVFSLENIQKKDTDTLIETQKQLQEYFSKQRKDFSIKLKPKSSEFSKKVYDELLKIKYGELCTYKDIAIRMNNPKACRAVGKANNKNPIPIIIPCHRVIGSNNKLVGYSSGLEIKEFLIELEKNERRS